MILVSHAQSVILKVNVREIFPQCSSKNCYTPTLSTLGYPSKQSNQQQSYTARNERRCPKIDREKLPPFMALI